MGALDTELSRYVTRPNWAAYRVRVEGSSRFTKARLSPSDVHMLHLGLRRAWPQDKNATAAFIREQAEEALREDPHNAGAMLALAYLDGPPNSERVRAIVASVPADWRGWRVLGGLRDVPSAEREMANRKAIELNPEDAMSLNNLAWLLALSDRPSEALAFANRALDLAPWNSNYIDTLAEIAARMKRCSEALRLIGRASRILELRGENRETTSKRQSAIAGQCPTTSAAH
jgi:tetratricopeptide (TPR) repeat protein